MLTRERISPLSLPIPPLPHVLSLDGVKGESWATFGAQWAQQCLTEESVPEPRLILAKTLDVSPLAQPAGGGTVGAAAPRPGAPRRTASSEDLSTLEALAATLPAPPVRFGDGSQEGDSWAGGEAAAVEVTPGARWESAPVAPPPLVEGVGAVPTSEYPMPQPAGGSLP